MKEPIYAIRAGTVLVAKSMKDHSNPYGNRVYIVDEDGYMTLYAHLDSFKVTTGQKVGDKELIGYMGKTGTEEVHLHLGLFKPGDAGVPANAIDPAPYVAAYGMPCKRLAINPFGSKYRHSSLSTHEGIDFSGLSERSTKTLDGLQATTEFWKRTQGA